MITASELMKRKQIDYAEALEIMMVAESQKEMQLSLLIYHSCSKELILTMPFGDGFPNLPITCPHCGKTIADQNELLFEVAGRFNP
jgi:hypothetical protein